jgi:uracil-DNA glycosylase family 4
MSAERDALAAGIAACRRCPGLNVDGVTGSAPGYGSETSPVMLVGQSLCKLCMKEPPEPFRGGSEWLITRALKRADRVKEDLFVTNVVHCHPAPPDDRPSEPHEIANCAEYLRRELALVRPQLIVALGGDAHTATRNDCRRALVIEWRRFATRPVLPADGSVVLCLPHPSHVKFWLEPEREQWIEILAAAVRWGFTTR